MFIWKHRKFAAIVGGVLALAGGVALAAWLTLSTLTITPNTYNTGSVQVAGLQVDRGTDCTTVITQDIWTPATAAIPGDLASGSMS